MVVRRDKTKKMSSKINENELINFKRVERMERAPARNLKFSHQLENWSRDESTDLVLLSWTSQFKIFTSFWSQEGNKEPARTFYTFLSFFFALE